MPQLEFQDVSLHQNEKSILSHINIAIEKGDYLSIVGHSGSGKSTFLKLCCHLTSPTAGHIFLDGMDLMQWEPTDLRKDISYVFQTPVLFGKTVEDNLLFPCQIRKAPFDRVRASAWLNRFRLAEDILSHPIQTLSGGEKQRIALVRSLMFPPKILLLDEITSALDKENTLIVERAIAELNQEGITVLWVTHSDVQSLTYQNRRLTIENGQIQSLEVLR